MPSADLLAYCLMPNHFHFLIFSTDLSIKTKMIGKVESCELSNSFRLLQSKYAQYVNVKYKRSGSLFRQKAKAKNIETGSDNYPQILFDYIHNNPVEANLVAKPEEWPYSSYNAYTGNTWDTLCNFELATKLLGIMRNSANLCPKGYMVNEVQEIFMKGDFLKFL